MKKIPWYLIGFIFLGVGVGIAMALIASYSKAALTGGIEEETVGLFVLTSLLIFGSAGFLLGMAMEKRMNA